MSTSRHAAFAFFRAAPSFINRSSRFRDMAESCLRAPQPFQLAPPDPAFLVDAGTAASQHIKVLLVNVVLSAVLPGKASYASGKPPAVTIGAMTACTQSLRLSRL